MNSDNEAQTSASQALNDGKPIRTPPGPSYSPPHGAPLSKKPLTSPFNHLRLRHYLYISVLVSSILFFYRYYLQSSMSLPAHSVNHTTTEEARWDALSEGDQLAEAVAALSISGEAPRVSSDYDDTTLLETLDPALVPQPHGASSSSSGLKGRLIVVGDIHGMKSELEHLLEKLKFDKNRDHLICAGDMISKGPDSVGVVELLMELGASGVRGNHEDRILHAWKRMHAKSMPETPGSTTSASSSDEEPVDTTAELGGVQESGHSKRNKDKALAKQFTKAQVKWLKAMPVILNVGNLKGLGNLVVVHGGLVPGLRLEMQDPYIVMNIRTIDLKSRIPSEAHKGSVWTKLWNKFQHHIPEGKRMTVVYGHDSRRGLSIGDFTKGIDTGCLKGGKLTAFVIEGGKKNVQTSIEHVKCKKAHH